MERIMYRKTLDVHKNGIQFLLQGFETADNLSRVIEISLMASGDAIDFPLEKIEALMYVKTPNATEPSINKCTIKDNKVVYEVLPIVEEGITNMQLKIIESEVSGATGILASPKFAVEVTKSDADDSGAEQTTTFTALENAMAKAKSVYDERFLRMELTSDCIFRAYYADGTVYETDLLKRLFHEGNSLLSESFAHGSTGIRAGEDTDNSMYYSNVSKSEALNAKNIMENSEKLLEEVKLHGVYTAFGIDFESGEVEYVSPSFKFKIDLESGELDVIGQNYTFDNEVGRIVDEWLLANNIVLKDLQAISTTHAKEITGLKITTETHTEDINMLKDRVTPVEKGGTGANTLAGALKNLGVFSTDIASLFGSESLTPDSVFKQLGSHWWKRYNSVIKTDMEGPNRHYIGTGDTQYDTIDIYTAESFSVSYDSTANKYIYKLNNPECVAVSWSTTNGGGESIFKGKYWMIGTDAGYDLFYDISWGPVSTNLSDAKSWNYGNKEAYYGFCLNSRVAEASVSPEGEAEYVFASSESEYPKGLGEDQLFYEYLGIPFYNARDMNNVAKIAVGLYVGTGTYGSDNPTTIAVDFEPKVLYILGASDVVIKPYNAMYGWSNGINMVVWEEDSVSWYYTGTGTDGVAQSGQMNSPGERYYYFILG